MRGIILRLRKKPWISEALEEYSDILFTHPDETLKGNWRALAEGRPVYAELGTGKGRFITGMALRHPDVFYIGLEAQQDVIYYAAKKVREQGLTNVRLALFDVSRIEELFAPGEAERFYINFCDPWPKNRHAKRRLTHNRFLEKYRKLLLPGGEMHFKTDNEALFEFSLNEFAAADLRLSKICLDLHNSNYADNIMTEYEEKFSRLGMRIFRCETRFR